MEPTTPTTTTATTTTPDSEPHVMSAEEYEKRMSDLDKEHDRRAALLDPNDHDGLDRLASWHAKMTDTVDAQYCSPGPAAEDDVMSAAIAAAEFSGSNDEAAEVATALGGFGTT